MEKERLIRGWVEVCRGGCLKKREQSRTVVGSWEERKGGIIRENAGNQRGRKIGLADMFKRVPRRRIRKEWNERGWEIMRRRKRERGEWKDRDDFLFRQTNCGSFIISPRQLLRPPALSFSSLFPSLSLSLCLSLDLCLSLSLLRLQHRVISAVLPTLFLGSDCASVYLPPQCLFFISVCLLI